MIIASISSKLLVGNQSCLERAILMMTPMRARMRRMSMMSRHSLLGLLY